MNTIPEKIVYINLFDQIDHGRVQAIMAFCSNLVANEHPSKLHFLLSSPGGSVDAGIALYNFLKALPVKIVMHNTGTIDSIATVIFLAGDERYAAPHSSFLFHGVAAQFPANTALTLPHLQERVSCIRQDQNKIAGIISASTKLTPADIESLFAQGESKDIDFAIDKGIVHERRDPLIPVGSKFVTLSFQQVAG